jgi:adenine-specific DNA-methyltransferase
MGTMTENGAFLTRQLITCLGNKRALLDFIGEGAARVRQRLGKKKLSVFDVFSGSGIAARYFKRFSSLLIANDLEPYSAAVNRCYLSNKSSLDTDGLEECYRELKSGLADGSLRGGIISGLYAPEDDTAIKPGERVFYTKRNAMYIDTARRLIGSLPRETQTYFIAPLLSEASIHANTSGVFKGFYKNRETGIGRFGGKNSDALERITGEIRLPFPVFSNFESEVIVYNGDANTIIFDAPEVDLAYLDPPYNQHPYGSNYFMLNLILDYQYPEHISAVAGIPGGWNRSGYNRRRRALAALGELVFNIRAKYVLISFNSEGFISPGEMKAVLEKIGRIEVTETPYNTFRGSRNLNNRNIHVKEFLYLVEK